MSRRRSVFQAAVTLHTRLKRTLVCVVVACLLAAVAVQLGMAREATYLQATQLAKDHGRQIELLLERGSAASARRDALLQNYFDEHRLLRLELRDGGATPVFSRAAPATASTIWQVVQGLLHAQTPVVDWPLRARGASVSSAQLRIEPPMAELRSLQTQAIARFTLWMVAVSGVILMLGNWALRKVRTQVAETSARAIRAAADEASARQLQAIRSSPTQPPAALAIAPRYFVDELARLELALSSQGEELEAMRRMAYVDALTGLPTRRQVMSEFEIWLEGADAWPAACLLLLRVRDLEGVNRRTGHAGANQVLQAVAKVVQTAAASVEGTAFGRLNGSDFALLMPRKGVARQTASGLLSAARQVLINIDPAGGLALGAVDLQGPISTKQAMALADEVLANAEADALFAFAVASNASEKLAFGDSVWQFRLADALAHRRTVLAGYPLCGRDGRVLHLDCPMRVQFEVGGPYESAWRWLALAARGRLSAEIDLRVVQMALEAILHDGQARCVNIAAQSLASSEFMLKVMRELEAAPSAAKHLLIDLPEALALDRPALVHEATRRWRPMGVRVALEHAGENLARIDHLNGLGMDSVRIDGRYFLGLTGANSGNVRRHLQAAVKLAHDAGLKITAEGLTATGDLALVWAMGFDGATGPAVLKRHQSMSLQ